VPTAGSNLLKICVLIPRAASQRAIALIWEEAMKRLCLGVVVAAILTFPALADPPQLRSNYVWTYSDTCLVASGGFSVPPGLAPGGASALGQTYSTSNADTGIEHFNPDATGFVRGQGFGVNLGSLPQPAGSGAPGSFSFEFTYVFNSDDTFTMTVVPGSFVGYDPTGKIPVATLNGMQWLGNVSKDAKSHTLTTVTPFVQTVTIIGPPSIIIYRMCRSNVVGFAAD
jgi:hypothetical protein